VESLPLDFVCPSSASNYNKIWFLLQLHLTLTHDKLMSNCSLILYHIICFILNWMKPHHFTSHIHTTYSLHINGQIHIDTLEPILIATRKKHIFCGNDHFIFSSINCQIRSLYTLDCCGLGIKYCLSFFSGLMCEWTRVNQHPLVLHPRGAPMRFHDV
jgi:hypothetical protein